MALTNFCITPVTFHGKVVKAIVMAAIEDNSGTKTATNSALSKRILHNLLGRSEMATCRYTTVVSILFFCASIYIAKRLITQHC